MTSSTISLSVLLYLCSLLVLLLLLLHEQGLLLLLRLVLLHGQLGHLQLAHLHVHLRLLQSHVLLPLLSKLNGILRSQSCEKRLLLLLLLVLSGHHLKSSHVVLHALSIRSVYCTVVT